MIRRAVLLVLVLAWSPTLAAQAPARPAPPPDVDQWVARAMKTFDVPTPAL